MATQIHTSIAGVRFDRGATDTLGFADRVRLAIRRRNVRKQILNELEPLRDRELADLGISRADIPAIAAQHALMTVTPASLRR